MKLRRAIALVGAFGLAMSVLLPATTGMAESETVLTNDFEDATTQGWFGRGDALVEVSGDEAHAGAASLLTTGRTDTWQGPGRDMNDVLVAGATYEIEVYARSAGGDGDVTMTVQRTPAGGDTAYETVAWQVPVTDSEWVRVAGSYSFDTADNDELQLYVESPDAGLSYYIDDVVVVMTAPPPGGSEVLVSTDFETGTTEGWNSRSGNEVVEASDLDAHEGDYSLLTTNRTETWHGPVFEVTTLLEVGKTYEFDLWLKLAPGQEPADLRFSIQQDSEGESTYTTLIPNTEVGTDEWQQMSGTFTCGAEVDAAFVYAESASEPVDFFMDDFVMSVQIPPEIQDIPPLQDVLADSFVIGSAIDERETLGAPAELLTLHFNSITGENAMKPESIQPTEGNFTFEEADALVEFAEANDMLIYGHTLLWHSQTPEWFWQDENGDPLTDSPEDRQIALDRMEAHIQAVADHYGDRVWAWDVVNEAIDESQADGLRRSPWYEIIGPNYLTYAFEFAREAFGPDVKLFLNDYNTEFPAKREAMYNVVAQLQADGVPIDGVGHQLHMNLVRPVQYVDDTLTRFSDLGLLQAVTELDVSISTSTSESLPSPPPDRVIRQGYYYRDLFEVLRKHGDQLASVTMWGLYDARSWLRYWPTSRPHEAPLLFDDQLQAKPAYWGIVDPEQLPHYPQHLNIPGATPVVDGERDLVWELLPETILKGGEEGEAGTGFQARWDTGSLFVMVEIADDSIDAGDRVDLFVDDTNAKSGEYGEGDTHYAVLRDGTTEGAVTASVVETDVGYRVEALMPLMTPADLGREIGFDIRVTEAGSGELVSWSDQDHAQDTDTSRWGTLTAIEAQSYVDIPYSAAAPVVDGVIDDVWEDASMVTTNVLVEGDAEGAKGDFRVLWDDTHLYVLAEVTDPVLDAENSNAWEQDSVEVFVDPGNTKSGAYKPSDGQYRISFENLTSINGDLSVIGESLESAAVVVDGGYLVEVSIDLVGMTPEPGAFIGLEFQVNDATDGTRTAVHTWHDPTGQSYQDSSRWGVGHLIEPAPVCDVTIDGLHRGPLKVRSGVTCLTENAVVRGPVSVHNGASLIADGGKVIGPITTRRADTVILKGVRVIGPVTILRTQGEVVISGNVVRGPVVVIKNATGDNPIVVSGNKVGNILACYVNEPAPTNNDEPNDVGLFGLGQCRDL